MAASLLHMSAQHTTLHLGALSKMEPSMPNGARALLPRHNEMGRMSLAIDSSPLHARLRYRIPLHLLEEADVTRQARADA